MASPSDNRRPPALLKGPVGPLRHRCAHCSATGPALLRCSGCHAVRYCGRDHQIAHRPQHKPTCNRTKKARAKLATEEQRIRDAASNAFDTDVGLFYETFHTREYLIARRDLAAKGLVRQATLDGVRETLDHMRAMMRLSRGDILEMRQQAPCIMLRLDLDQECYDFIRGWAGVNVHGDFDHAASITWPHLDLRGADVFDSRYFLDTHHACHHLIALLLLKLKLLVDIRNLKVMRKVLARLAPPADLWRDFESAALRSPLSARFLRESPPALAQTETSLLSQVCVLGSAVDEWNPNFMRHLFEPDKSLFAEIWWMIRPGGWTRGSWEELAMAMQNSYYAWYETEGVLDLMWDARVCARRDARDQTRSRIWDHLLWAVEDASYLGPWAKRPSERRMEEARRARERAGGGEAGSNTRSGEGERRGNRG